MKKHNRIIRIIYRTKDYSRFVMDEMNRDTRNNGALEESMRKYGWIEAYPAFVTPDDRGRLLIKDGQHRFCAAKKLGLEIVYVICETDSISIPELNNIQKRWVPADYISSFAKQGKRDYIVLKDFCETHGLSPMISANILAGVVGSVSPELKSGEFKVRDIDRAESVVRVVNTAKNCGISWAKNTRFITAIVQIFRYTTASPVILCDKIRKHPGVLMLMPTTESFVSHISREVYNRNTKRENVLDIEAGVRAGVLATKVSARNGSNETHHRE